MKVDITANQRHYPIASRHSWRGDRISLPIPPPPQWLTVWLSGAILQLPEETTTFISSMFLLPSSDRRLQAVMQAFSIPT